jgi:hypothetical protein
VTRIALLGDGDATALAAALRERGHPATAVRARALPGEGWLRRRGFTGPLTPVPLQTVALLRGDYGLVHAFSATDALAARLWRRASGGPVVVTVLEVLDRGRLADTRLRLPLLQAAVEQSDVVLAASGEVRDALRRWLAVDARVVDPVDAAAHARVYDALR